MKRKVNATRMELLRVRKRLDLAVRGHKLLKDKLEGLIRELTLRLQEYKSLRIQVDEQWPLIFQRFVLAGAETSAAVNETALEQARPRLRITTKIRRVMGVATTEAAAELESAGGAFSLWQTSPQLDQAIRSLRDFLPTLIKLAGVEQSVRALAAEVEKTRRRSNALEYVMIPDLRQAKRDISSRLEEIGRSDISRLMKVKAMLVARDELT